MLRKELVCDYCGKVAAGGEYHCELPEGWYVLGYHCQTHLIDDWRPTHHFCSRRCLAKGAKVQGLEE